MNLFETKGNIFSYYSFNGAKRRREVALKSPSASRGEVARDFPLEAKRLGHRAVAWALRRDQRGGLGAVALRLAGIFKNQKLPPVCQHHISSREVVNSFLHFSSPFQRLVTRILNEAEILLTAWNASSP